MSLAHLEIVEILQFITTRRPLAMLRTNFSDANTLLGTILTSFFLERILRDFLQTTSEPTPESSNLGTRLMLGKILETSSYSQETLWFTFDPAKYAVIQSCGEIGLIICRERESTGDMRWHSMGCIGVLE